MVVVVVVVLVVVEAAPEKKNIKLVTKALNMSFFIFPLTKETETKNQCSLIFTSKINLFSILEIFGPF